MMTMARNINSEYSVVLRYHEVMNGLVSNETLRKTSIREGVRIVPLDAYKGVNIFLLDESSMMHSGTYKSVDGCVVSAICLEKGIKDIICSSGANTGTALSLYCMNNDIGVYFFHPRNTLYKIDKRLKLKGNNRIISVEGGDQKVKRIAKEFSENTGIPMMPTKELRVGNTKLFGKYIYEFFNNREYPEWIGQTVCAGYGPLGIYGFILKSSESGRRIPRLMAFQQSANPSLVDISGRTAVYEGGKFIEPVLYNTMPETQEDLLNLISSTGGALRIISNSDYKEFSEDSIDLLANSGLNLTTMDNGEFLEKTGLMTGIGIMSAIDSGMINKGENILWIFTGGVNNNFESSIEKPDMIITENENYKKYMDRLMKEFI